ncbi:MAG TPA: LysR substrate-binding domain-containing protein [Polyangiaceae bacterium]|nr:LysR substrate-binding domain-containing protein [Polyangiaceae bacterium]
MADAPRPRLDDLVQFAAVAGAGSIAGAARELGLPASTLSRRLGALERRLGVRLVERTTRSLHLTEAGALFYERCARLASDAVEAEALVSSHGRTPRGTLRLSAPPALGAWCLGPVLAAYARRHPAVRLEMALSERAVDLRGEAFDVAVRVGVPPSDGSYIVRRLGHSSRVLCASPEYLRARGEPSTAAALREHELVAYGGAAGGAGWHSAGPAANAGAPPLAPRLRTNNSLLARELCRAGAGLALLPRFLVEADLRSGALVAVSAGEPPTPLAVLLLTSPASAATPKVRAFVSELREYVARERPWT